MGLSESVTDGVLALAELYNLSKTESPKFVDLEAEAAQAAIESIRTAVGQGKEIQVLNPEGRDITSTGVLDGKVSSTHDDNQQDAEEIVIGISRQASDLSSRGQPVEPDGTAKPAILVTEDRSTRLKAKDQGVATLSISMVRRVLEAFVRRRSSSAASSIRHSGIFTPTDIPL